jgi:hypothetical protein
MKSSVFCYVGRRNSTEVSGLKVSQTRNQQETGMKLSSVGFMPGLLFSHEDGGEMFFRKVSRLSAGYTALYPRK